MVQVIIGHECAHIHNTLGATERKDGQLTNGVRGKARHSRQRVSREQIRHSCWSGTVRGSELGKYMSRDNGASGQQGP